MFKKISLLLLFMVLATALVGCQGETKSDYDIIYELKQEIDFETFTISEDIVIPSIDNDDVTVTWVSSKPDYISTDGSVTRPDYEDGDQNVELSVTLTLNDAVTTKIFQFTVLKLDEIKNTELNTDLTDALQMDFTYETTSFLSDTAGEVTLERCVDGDTAIFRENGQTFTVRFLGIDTPESTYRFDPWGKAASAYTCDKLTNATTIVLEYDPLEGRTDNNGRYLAWVWYDGRLINLELVEQAYSLSKGVTSKYGTLLLQAELKTTITDRRIWGEDDPDYDYSLEGVQITIEELVTNQELYIGIKVVIHGVISRKVEGHPYIQEGDYGVYLYTGYVASTSSLTEGNEVIISGLTPTYYPDVDTGALQLTGFSRQNIQVVSTGNTVDPVLVTINELTENHIGSFLKLQDLEVVSVYEGTDGAFTITAEDASGNRITVRRHAGVDSDITADLFTVGTMFDIVAPLGKYEGNLQLLVSHLEDVTFK